MVHAQRRLEWVSRNRRRRESVRPAGECVAQAVRGAGRTDGALLTLLSERLGSDVNEEFRRHCRAAAVQGGRLIVNVDAPSMVSMMRTRWRQILLRAARQKAPRAKLGDVIFAFGMDGLPFGDPDRETARRAPLTAQEQMEPGAL